MAGALAPPGRESWGFSNSRSSSLAYNFANNISGKEQGGAPHSWASNGLKTVSGQGLAQMGASSTIK